MFVTRHARTRFELRINSAMTYDERVQAILKAWYSGRTATNDDLSLYRAKRHDECEYRVGKFDTLYFLLVAENNVITTLLELR